MNILIITNKIKRIILMENKKIELFGHRIIIISLAACILLFDDVEVMDFSELFEVFSVANRTESIKDFRGI